MEALLRRGVLGYWSCFHGYRKSGKTKTLRWGPHFHTISALAGSYDCCRNCGKVPSIVNCEGCGAFEARTRACNVEDGFIVKVHGERKTIAGTIRYVLSHATHRVGLKTFHMVTWGGVMGNRKFKGRKLPALSLCPVCEREGEREVMVPCVHRGKEEIVTNVGSSGYLSYFPVDDFDGGGCPIFVDLDDVGEAEGVGACGC